MQTKKDVRIFVWKIDKNKANENEHLASCEKKEEIHPNRVNAQLHMRAVLLHLIIRDTLYAEYPHDYERYYNTLFTLAIYLMSSGGVLNL